MGAQRCTGPLKTACLVCTLFKACTHGVYKAYIRRVQGSASPFFAASVPARCIREEKSHYMQVLYARFICMP